MHALAGQGNGFKVAYMRDDALGSRNPIKLCLEVCAAAREHVQRRRVNFRSLPRTACTSNYRRIALDRLRRRGGDTLPILP